MGKAALAQNQREKLCRTCWPRFASDGLDLGALTRFDGAENSVELLGVDVEARFGPDHVVGFSEFLFNRPLRSNALVDLVLGPSASGESLALCGFQTSQANRRIQF